jgi:hypothetical protein
MHRRPQASRWYVYGDKSGKPLWIYAMIAAVSLEGRDDRFGALVTAGGMASITRQRTAGN